MQLPEEDTMARDLRQIRQAAERGANLTQQLLAFSRKKMLEVECIALNTVITDFVRLLRRLIGEDVILATSLDPKLGCIKADVAQVQQILMNLAVNARDAMPHGGTLIIETAETQLEESFLKSHPEAKPGRYVVLTVGDTGTGISPQVMSHIFEPFFTTKEQGKGTGLGLSTVYGLVRQHEGIITAESEIGKGTTFHVYFPRTENTAKPVKRNKSSKSLTGTETILVVEDDDVVRELAVDVLHSHSYKILMAANAHEAMNLLNETKEKVDLYLLDIVMPGKNGREFYKEISQIHPGIPAIFMSGYMEQRDATIQWFLQKPFSVVRLLQMVRRVLDEKTAETATSQA